ADGTTVSDAAPDEKTREMSISSSLASFDWQDRKINLMDTPGEPSFVADALAALSVSEGAVFVVNAVMGVEVNSDRLGQPADELMERYLEGEEISHEELVTTLKKGVTEGHLFPVTCGVATKNLATNRLLDAFVEDLPSPVMRGAVQAGEVTLGPDPDKPAVAFVFKTLADPFAGRINLFRVYQGTINHDTQVFNTRAHSKERVGQLLVPQGKEMGQTDEFG